MFPDLVFITVRLTGSTCSWDRLARQRVTLQIPTALVACIISLLQLMSLAAKTVSKKNSKEALQQGKSLSLAPCLKTGRIFTYKNSQATALSTSIASRHIWLKGYIGRLSR
jgi:hypothetical protein